MAQRFTVDDDLVQRLAQLLNETGLSEIEYAKGDERIRVSRAAPLTAAPAAASFSEPSPAPSSLPEPALQAHAGAVTAPMVGTIYLSPEPGAPPFVSVGDTVAEGDTLFLIEAMKTYNEVRAPRAGKVADILVTDACPVEYGETLLVLE